MPRTLHPEPVVRPRRSNSDVPTVPLRGVQVVIILLGLVLVGVSTVVFVGASLALELLPHASVAAVFAGMYALGSRGEGRLAQGLRLLAPLGLSLFVLGALLASLWASSTTLTTSTAAGVSVPFLVFLALLATSRIELGFLLSVSALHYVVGIWRTPQGPEFLWLFLAGVVAFVGLLALSTLREALRGHMRRHAERASLGLDNALVSGRTPPVSLTGALTVLAALVLFATAALFVVLPRPDALAEVMPADGARAEPRYVKGEGTPLEGGEASREAEGSGREGAGARMGLARFLRTEAGSTLLEEETPHYRLVAHQDNKRVRLDPRMLYLRAAVYDHYDGETWTASTEAQAHWQSVSSRDGVRFPLGRAIEEDRAFPGYARQLRETLQLSEDGSGAKRHRIEYEVVPTGADQSDIVPLPRFALNTSATELEYNTYFDIARRPAWSPFSRYRVEAFAIVPQADWLDDDVISPELAGGIYLQLPETRSGYYAELAQEIVTQWGVHTGETLRNDYDVARAVEGYFRRHGQFQYSLTAPQLEEEAEVSLLETFLRDSRSGPCTLYASGATVLLRELGLSARVVAGYHGGEFEPRNQSYYVLAKHAHAWIEVYFQGYGWFPFDPTPPQQRADALGASDANGEPQEDGEADEQTEPSSDEENEADEHPASEDDVTSDEPPTSGETPRDVDSEDDEGEAASSTDDNESEEQAALASEADNVVGGFSASTRADLFGALTGALSSLRENARLGLALLLLACSLLFFVVWLKQRRHRRPRDEVHRLPYRRAIAGTEEARWVNGYDRALARLKLLGLERLPRQTPAEFARTVRQRLAHHPAAAASFERLTEWFYRLRFGHETLSAADCAELDRLWSAFETELHDSATPS